MTTTRRTSPLHVLVLAALSCGLALSTTTARAEAEKIEVMHFWTSGGEAAALGVLKEEVKKRGYGWLDSPIAGGGGEQARTTLRARVAAGNPPEAAMTLGFTTLDYAEEGLLGNLDALAQKEGWDKVIPLPVQKFAKYENHWVAAPLLVHRSNWVWANKKIFDELKLTPPKTFAEMLVVADKMKKAGYTPLAHGGQAWQEAALFDSAVLSAGGPKFYKQAMIDLDPAALGSKTMEKAFDQMLALRQMVDANFAGRDWNLATAMVINGKAGMQVMGDWAKGEFANAGKKANVDYICFPYPGTDDSFIFLVNEFAMFKSGDAQQKREEVLASAIMDKGQQERFSLLKGSIPARLDASLDAYDDCGKKSMQDMKAALKSNNLLGSFAFGHAMNESTKGAVYDVVTKFFNSGKSSADAVKQLVKVVKSAQ